MIQIHHDDYHLHPDRQTAGVCQCLCVCLQTRQRVHHMRVQSMEVSVSAGSGAGRKTVRTSFSLAAEAGGLFEGGGGEGQTAALLQAVLQHGFKLCT